MSFHDNPLVIEVRTFDSGEIRVTKVHPDLTDAQREGVVERLEGFNPGDALFRLVADLNTGRWRAEVTARSLDPQTTFSLADIIFDPLRVELRRQSLH